MNRVAWRILSPANREDAVQEGLVRVWKKIGYIDCTRPGTVKPLIMKIGMEAMRDVRRVERRQHLDTVELQSGIFEPPDRKQEAEWTEKDFSPLLRRYVRYIRKHGTMMGSHSTLARSRGKKVAWMTTRFHREAKRLRDENNGKDPASGS